MKKVISAILCLSMIFSLMAPAFAYCDSIEENESKPFSYTTKEIFVPLLMMMELYTKLLSLCVFQMV